MIRAIKVETESEGATFDKILFLKNEASNLGVPMLLKIGGAEALNDLAFARTAGIQHVVAPLIESAFGVQKFATAALQEHFSWRAVTIESKQAFENIDSILDALVQHRLNGLTIGRGDLADSLGEKGRENSSNVMEVVKEIALKSRLRGIPVTIGGRIDAESLDLLAETDFPFDYIETRRVVLEFEDLANEETFGHALVAAGRRAIELEIDFEERLLDRVSGEQKLISDRISSLRARL